MLGKRTYLLDGRGGGHLVGGADWGGTGDAGRRWCRAVGVGGGGSRFTLLWREGITHKVSDWWTAHYNSLQLSRLKGTFSYVVLICNSMPMVR